MSQKAKDNSRSLYDFPEVYDQVLCHKPEVVKEEVRSICALLDRHQITSGRILELACGTCAHAIALTRCGYRLVGLDRSRNMLDGAKRKAQEQGVILDLREGDIVSFDLGSSIDAAIFMSETFPMIVEHDEIRAHFQSVQRHLRDGGIYIIDIDAHRHGVGTSYGVWGERTVPIKGGKVEIRHESFPGDWVKGTSRMKMHCRIHLDNEVHETTDEWILRVDSPWNLGVLVETLSGWILEGFYSWRGLGSDISQEDHFFMVLKKEVNST